MSAENLRKGREREREQTDRDRDRGKGTESERNRESTCVCARLRQISRISLHTCETDRYSAILSVISVLEGAEYKINLVDNSFHAVT